MIYWKVRFDDGDHVGQEGWLEIEEGADSRVFLEDGTAVTSGVSYTTIDTNPTPPVWGT
jgi:hypothetical protein